MQKSPSQYAKIILQSKDIHLSRSASYISPTRLNLNIFPLFTMETLAVNTVFGIHIRIIITVMRNYAKQKLAYYTKIA